MLIYNSITMSEVLAMNEFTGATLVSGEAGLNNEVNWIHPLEIWDDPNEWIDGGELIFCCALGVNDPDTLVVFFKKLLKKGIAGFCLQLHSYMDKVPQEMLDLANEYRCPLIAFKRPVRFIDVSRSLVNTIIKNVNQDYLREKQKLEDNCWMLDWLNNGLSTEAICQHLKMSLGEFDKFHFFTVVIEYSKSKITYQWSEGIYLSIAKKLREIFENKEFLFYPFFANGLLAGIIFDFGKTSCWKRRFNDVVKDVNENLRIQEGKPVLILAAGDRSKEIAGIPNSYKTAVETLQVCQQFHVDKYIYEDLNLYFILSLIGNANNLDRIQDFVKEQIAPLINPSAPQNSKLMDTLKKYYQCNGNKQLTAKELNITRQTLYHRLEQIEELLQADLLNTEKRLTLEISFAFHNYLLKMV